MTKHSTEEENEESVGNPQPVEETTSAEEIAEIKTLTDEIPVAKSDFWKLVRIQNLVIISLTLFIFTVVQAQYHIAEIKLFAGAMLLICSILIAAAGYILNDIYDVETDKINKPDKVFIDNTFSRTKAWFVYGIMSLLGVVFGFLVSYQMGFIAVTVVMMLYFYSADLKKTVLKGNLLISFLSASVVFSSSQAVTDPNPMLLIFYTFFAFFVSFKRELIKDAEDIEGDEQTGAITFPVKFGFKKTVLLSLFISLIVAVLMLLAVTQQVEWKEVYLYVMLGLVILPLFAGDVIIWLKPTKKIFGIVSLILKIVMIVGILSAFLFNNA